MKRLLGMSLIIAISSFMNVAAMEDYRGERAVSPELMERIQREEREERLRRFEEQERQQREAEEEERRQYMRRHRGNYQPRRLFQ